VAHVTMGRAVKKMQLSKTGQSKLRFYRLVQLSPGGKYPVTKLRERKSSIASALQPQIDSHSQ